MISSSEHEMDEEDSGKSEYGPNAENLNGQRKGEMGLILQIRVSEIGVGISSATLSYAKCAYPWPFETSVVELSK